MEEASPKGIERAVSIFGEKRGGSIVKRNLSLCEKTKEVSL